MGLETSKRRVQREIAKRKLSYAEIDRRAGKCATWTAQIIHRIGMRRPLAMSTIGMLAAAIGCGVEDLCPELGEQGEERELIVFEQAGGLRGRGKPGPSVGRS